MSPLADVDHTRYGREGDLLRTLTIPPNGSRLPEGTWLRWSELRLFLLGRGQDALAYDIEQQLLHGQEVEVRERTVRV